MPEQAWALWPWMHLAGRILFCSFCIVYGLQAMVQSADVLRYFRHREIPGPRPVAAVTGAMLATGGVLVLLGWSRFIGAGLVFLALFPGAFALHPFWRESDPTARQAERAQFWMTLSLSGAALFVAYYGHTWWPLSVVNW